MGYFGLDIGGPSDQVMTGLKALVFRKGQDLTCWPLDEGGGCDVCRELIPHPFSKCILSFITMSSQRHSQHVATSTLRKNLFKKRWCKIDTYAKYHHSVTVHSVKCCWVYVFAKPLWASALVSVPLVVS